MRILQCYRFLVGTKIPFDQWPRIIEDYLHRHDLTPRMFHYCLEDYDNTDRARSVLDGTKCETCPSSTDLCGHCRKRAADLLCKGTACDRALKEAPYLGPIKIRRTRYDLIRSLNNFDDTSDQAKDQIYPIISKIYRRYGFAHSSLIYRDIDFFSRRVPTPTPEPEYLLNGYPSSGITLHRSCISNDNAIILVVDSCYPGQIPDASPYADALGQLLPGIKRLSATKIIMEEEERGRYEEIHRRAGPLVKQARAAFLEQMPEEKGNDEPGSKVSVASWLKKLGKRHGYAYLGYRDHVYSMEKKLPNGHYICLEFVSAPLSADADPIVSLCGLGFEHKIWTDGFSPQNPRDASEYFTKLFDVLSLAESTVFPAILDLYPPSPDWFIPTR